MAISPLVWKRTVNGYTAANETHECDVWRWRGADNRIVARGNILTRADGVYVHTFDAPDDIGAAMVQCQRWVAAA